MYTQYWDLGAQWEYTIIITDNGPEIVAGLKNK
jgi:methionine aminopeptidase